MIRNMFKKLEFVRIAFVACVGFPLFIATSASAQNPAGEASTERVIVTGSNIPTAEEVTANPVDTVTEADIQRSGEATDVLQILNKREPDFVGSGNLGQTNGNIGSGFTQGGAIVSLRGLPTLVLFENRRFADSAAIATGQAVFKDVTLFPTALISRIEVLKDGASALYGSEAVGGVVNVFLKDDFQGVEIGFRYGDTVESSTPQRRSYVIAGVGNETTHVVAAIQYVEQDPLFERERGYSSVVIGGASENYGGGGFDSFHGGTPDPTFGTTYYTLQGFNPPTWASSPPTVNSPFQFYAPHSIPVPVDTNFDPVTGQAGSTNTGQYGQMPLAYQIVTFDVADSYNLHLRPTLTLELSNTNAYASFTHKICGDQLEIFGNFMFSHNHNESDLNANPLTTASGVTILGTMRVDPVTGLLVAENRGPAAPYNPFQETLDSTNLGSGVYQLYAAQRYNANKFRHFINDNDFYRALGGVKSQINKDWYAEAAAYYSHYAIEGTTQNLVRSDILNALIAKQDAKGNPVPGQTLDFFAYDPLNDGTRSIDPAVFNTLFGNNIRKQDSYQRAFDAHITGFPLELPGGPVGVSGGVEYRAEGFKVIDTPEIFVGSVPISPIDVGRNIFSAYAELRIPIVGSEMNVPFIYNMEVEFAGRYDNYERLNTDSRVPKVMLRYQPIKDITLRGTYSNSFIAPDLFSLFGPSNQGFSPSIKLPGAPSQQAQVQTGSNPNLAPSTAQSWTGGIVYSPHQIPGLTFNADYFWTLQQQIVGVLGGATILGSVDNLGPASPYASLVAKGNYPGQPGAQPITAPHQLAGHLSSIFYIDANLNIGADRTEGWDLGADYNIDLQSWGIPFGFLEIGTRAVVFMGNDERTQPQSPYFNISGLIGDEGFGGFPDYKITSFIEHRWHGATLGLNANYIPEMKNIVGEDPAKVDQSTLDKVDDYIEVDGRISYTFHQTAPEPAAVAPKDGKDGKDGKNVPGVVPAASCWSVEHWLDGLTLTVGCNNMFDEVPRLVVNANGNTNLAVYDPYGRFVYFEVAKKF